MIVGILQPSYLPWIGYFEMISKCDVFVFYDDVQYDKGGWRNRNKIKTSQGWQWVTVPVKIRGNFGIKINEVRIMGDEWRNKHCKTFEINYKRALFFDKIFPILKDILNQKWEYLADLNINLIKKFSDFLSLKTQFIKSSDLGINGERSEKLLKICKYLKAEKYYATSASQNYLDINIFKQANITVDFQNYNHPIYPQLFGDFISHLSIVDLLFNCGRSSIKIIKGEKSEDT